MMSAAISMMAGLEQTKVGPVSGDLFSGLGELEGASFAKSLSESVGVPALAQGQNAAETDESLVPHVGVANGDQLLAPSVLSVDTPVVQRGTQTAEKVTEGVSLKKSVKALESSANQKTVQKTVGKIADAIAVEPKRVTGISTESAIPVVGQVVAPTVVPTVALQGEISKTPDASITVPSSPTRPATGISSIAIDGQARKDIATAAKTSVTDTAMTVTAGSDPVATPKTEMSPQRISAVAIAGGSDGEIKPQAARESGAALLHSMGIVPTAGVSGSTPAELGPTKLAAGDAGPHMVASPTGSTGQ